MNLKQLSALLGLSQTTVSRALNGYADVSAATRARVLAAAEAHDYRPNTRARALATGRSGVIGHVIPRINTHAMVNPIFADFIAGAGETYSQAGYEMLISVVDDGEEEKAYRSMKRRGLVDGLVVSAPRMNDPRIALLDEIGLPYAVHGRATGADRPYCWVDVNNRRAFARATDFLIDLGHRRIGLINGMETMDFAHRRRRGYEEALRARGLAVDAALTRQDEMTEGYGWRAARELLALPDPPTAFLVSSVICMLGVRRAIEEAGLMLGRDVSAITHDDQLSYLRDDGPVPTFTATRSSVREAGQRLARMVIDRIDTPQVPHAHELLEAELIIGRSTGPAPR
ncbi:LacI family DNA-binding transcriptional regulator [Limimaricola cinnabarinus]|jgi:LacI family transcriptional regulator|uniref:LacI family transcriptional regulator n=1 Tax=Limimaricola cinnabarinus TaxID=1125964 RepID=A0A2G1MKB0_9RHOB|nr:substrate-binding domain-containing protein [Limimaricola cinnabarinus]PHP29188.1 LacI family transcriptional regulator [Limimaricola cinnabarinus]